MRWPVLVFSLFMHYASCRESGKYYDDYFYGKTKCCRPKNASQIEDSDSRQCMPPSWELLNTTNGRFKMSFNLYEDSEQYLVDLYVKENVTSEQCKTENISTEFWQRHTHRKELSVTDWKEGCTECDKTGEFYFQFMFTGCYILQPPGQKLASCRTTFLESKYQKQVFDNKSIEALPSSNPMSLRINMNENPWSQMLLVKTNLHFILKNNRTLSTIKEWDLELQPDRQVKCLPIKPTSPDCDIDAQGMLVLSLGRMQPGDYKYDIKLRSERDVRCSLTTLWTNECQWKYEQVVTEELQKINIEYESPESPLYLRVYGPVLAGVFVVMIFMLIAIRYIMKRRLETVPVIEAIPVSVIGARPAILLLYSRDCDQFMKLMESFRRLLEKATEFEIYDCYDPERWLEVDRDPSAWMQRVTTMQDIRVVAVASHCARLRQRAHLDGQVVHFKTPRNTDKQFAYGLQLLTDGLTHVPTYRTTYVVRFSDFSDDSDLFVAMNSYTRFVLPSHLDKLVCSLKQSITDVQDGSWFQNEEGKIFLDNLNDLVRYKRENANYLQNLLVIENNPQQMHNPIAYIC